MPIVQQRLTAFVSLCSSSVLKRLHTGFNFIISIEHALNHQLLRWNQVGIFRVLGFQVGFATFDQIGFKRAPSLNANSNDLPVARLWSKLHHDNIPIANVFPNHGVTRYSQGKRVARWFDADALNVHRDAPLGVLFLNNLWDTNRDQTEQWNVHNAAELGQRGSGRSDRALPGSDLSNPNRFKAST